MKLVKLSCNNCRAQLDIDLDHLQAYCPYCGQKLLLDFDQIGHVLSEKEKTKRSLIIEEEQTKRLQMEHEYQGHKEKWGKILSIIEKVVLLLMMLTVIVFMLIMGGRNDWDHNKNNEVKITFSAKEVKGENYKDVKKRFESLGFTNIKLIKDEDLVIALFSKDGDVEKVTIAGDSSFSSGEWFPKNSEIVITYHTYK